MQVRKFTLAGSVFLVAGLSSSLQARPVEFEEIVQSAKHDPEYFELDFRSLQSVYAGGFSSLAQVHTILRDSATHYQEIQSGLLPSSILTRANKCYVSERNETRYRDSKEHLTSLSRDTAVYPKSTEVRASHL